MVGYWVIVVCVNFVVVFLVELEMIKKVMIFVELEDMDKILFVFFLCLLYYILECVFCNYFDLEE